MRSFPGNTSKNLTIYDIAVRTGVSYQTVSRVLNEMPHVAALASSSVKCLVSQLNQSKKAVRLQTLQPTFVGRESTAAPSNQTNDLPKGSKMTVATID